MVDRAIWKAVEEIVQGEGALSLAAAGGGSALLNWLFDHPGASRVMLEAQIPYAEPALEEYLQCPGPHRVTQETARNMAFTAYKRALRHGDRPILHCGVGLTAALATGRERRGADRVHLALRTGQCCVLNVLSLDKGAADRMEQEQVVSRWALCHIASVFDVRFDPSLPSWAKEQTEVVDLDDPLGLLLSEAVELVEITGAGTVSVDVDRSGRLLYPGSFNPLHEGHCQLAAAASALSSRPVTLEISVQNVDKPRLGRKELEARLEGIQSRFPVCLTREPTFFGKAAHFEAPHFAIGCDTAMRLVDEKYYDGGLEGMEQSLKALCDRGVHFWVAGRSIEGAYRTLDDVVVPSSVRSLFSSIPERAFRMDISSTEIRARNRVSQE